MDNRYFGLNGLSGLLISIALLLLIVIGLTYAAINVQKREATNYYSIDSGNVKMIDVSNKDSYRLNGVN